MSPAPSPLPHSRPHQIPEPSMHYGLTRLLDSPFDPSEGLVLQFEVTFANGHECGGSYLKLLTYDEVRRRWPSRSLPDQGSTRNTQALLPALSITRDSLPPSFRHPDPPFPPSPSSLVLSGL